MNKSSSAIKHIYLLVKSHTNIGLRGDKPSGDKTNKAFKLTKLVLDEQNVIGLVKCVKRHQKC